MVYAEVQSSLVTQLQTVTGLPALQPENTLINRKGQARTPYCRATLLPASSFQRSVGVNGKDEFPGLFQVDLFYPLDAGKTAVNAMADLVVQAFRRNVIALSTSPRQLVIHNAWVEAGISEEPYYNVPVVVRWSVIA